MSISLSLIKLEMFQLTSRILLLGLMLISTELKAQNAPKQWKGFLIDPDIYVLLPDSPKVSIEKSTKVYELNNDEVKLKIISLKSPLNFYGRPIKEVEDEYFGNLTQNTIKHNQKLISEDNFKFENQNVKKIIYSDTIDKRSCTVTLEILNVVGFEEAEYRFFLIDFKNRIVFPSQYAPFFSQWDLYYKIENNINSNKENENDFLKNKGFKIER